MKMSLSDSTQFSNKWLLILLLITILLTLWTAFKNKDIDNADAVELTEKHASVNFLNTIPSTSIITHSDQANASNNKDSLIPWVKLKREPLQGKTYNLFKVHSWIVVPPVKKVKPELLPPPVAPPAPFTYMGKFEDDPKSTQIFLMANGKLYSTRQGEKIDQQWRLDAEEVNTLRLTYLPLNLPQVLSKSARPLVSAVLPAVVAEANL